MTLYGQLKAGFGLRDIQESVLLRKILYGAVFVQDDRARQGKEICRAGVEFHNDDRRGKTSFGERFTDPFVRL